MKIQHFFFLLFLLFLQSLHAKNPASDFTFPRVVFEGELYCHLAPPHALNIDAVGSNWVDVSWPSVPGAAQYRLQAFDAVTNNELATAIFVPGTSNSATVSTTGNSGAVYVRIWSVCENGEWEPNNFTQSDNVDTIILDLVGNGFTYPINPIDVCPLGVGYQGGCDITWNTNQTPFRVSYTLNGGTFNRRFTTNVFDKVGYDVVNIKIPVAGNDGEHLFLAEGKFPEEVNISQIVIFYREELTETDTNNMVVLTRLGAGMPNANGDGKLFKWVTGDAACEVWKVAEGPIKLDNHSDGRVSSDLQHPVAYPNPFTDALTVQLPDTKDPSGTVMRLYDLLGAQKAVYQAPAGLTEFSFGTSQLEPGVYYLRVESNGKMETIKVVKTQ